MHILCSSLKSDKSSLSETHIRLCIYIINSDAADSKAPKAFPFLNLIIRFDIFSTIQNTSLFLDLLMIIPISLRFTIEVRITVSSAQIKHLPKGLNYFPEVHLNDSVITLV